MLTCSTLLNTSQMLFEMILLKFNANDIYQTDHFLGPLCFILFIAMTMFISIINHSFRSVRKNNQIIYNYDYDMFAFMWNRFQCWIRIKKLDEWELQEERDKRMRSEYREPIEQFPEKIDELLEALDQIYMSQQSHVLREENIILTIPTLHRRHSKLEI